MSNTISICLLIFFLGSDVNFGYGNIDKRNFAPYFPKTKSSPTSSATVHINLFISKINDDELWCADGSICHKSWIVTLVTSLLETFTNKSYLPKLIPLCKVVVNFHNNCDYLENIFTFLTA